MNIVTQERFRHLIVETVEFSGGPCDGQRRVIRGAPSTYYVNTRESAKGGVLCEWEYSRYEDLSGLVVYIAMRASKVER